MTRRCFLTTTATSTRPSRTLSPSSSSPAAWHSNLGSNVERLHLTPCSGFRAPIRSPIAPDRPSPPTCHDDRADQRFLGSRGSDGSNPGSSWTSASFSTRPGASVPPRSATVTNQRRSETTNIKPSPSDPVYRGLLLPETVLLLPRPAIRDQHPDASCATMPPPFTSMGSRSTATPTSPPTPPTTTLATSQTPSETNFAEFRHIALPAPRRARTPVAVEVHQASTA